MNGGSDYPDRRSCSDVDDEGGAFGGRGGCINVKTVQDDGYDDGGDDIDRYSDNDYNRLSDTVDPDPTVTPAPISI